MRFNLYNKHEKMSIHIFKPMSTSERDEQVVAIEQAINAVETIPFKQNAKWKMKFDKSPGIYFGFLDGKLKYIGETADIRARMSDLGRTYNHTLRKKIGVKKLNGELVGNDFSPEFKVELDRYMEEHLSIKAFPLNFGRKEVEDKLVEKHEKDLLNSVSLRVKKKK
jgi:hypothetical protein